MIQYTSGTTGFPKGAVLNHRGLVNNARFYASRCGATEETTWINIMPLFHTSGCGMVTLGCLQAGCRMVLVCLFDPDVVLNQLETSNADIILGVPTMVVSLLDAQQKTPSQFVITQTSQLWRLDGSTGACKARTGIDGS